MKQVITFSKTFTEEAILWDGSAEAWVAIYGLQWDDCSLRADEPGVMYVYGYGHTIPTGHWVFVGSGNRLDWLPVDEAEVVP